MNSKYNYLPRDNVILNGRDVRFSKFFGLGIIFQPLGVSAILPLLTVDKNKCILINTVLPRPHNAESEKKINRTRRKMSARGAGKTALPPPPDPQSVPPPTNTLLFGDFFPFYFRFYFEM